METPVLAGTPDLAGISPLVGEYQRRHPLETVLHQVVLENHRTFVSLREEEGRPPPAFVRKEFEKFLACGDLARGFLRLHCQACGYDRLVAFSCKCRGWCPSCVGRRMNDGAAFLTDRLIGDTPVRQWVLSLPHPLRYVLAYDSAILSEVVGAFVGAVFQHLRWKAKELLSLRSVSLAHPGAVTAVQRSSGDLSLNPHLHSLVTDGVFVEDQAERTVTFHALPPPTDGEVADVAWETCRRTRTILVRHGRWKDDIDETGEEDPAPEGLADLYAASLRGVLLFGARRGQRAVRFFGQAAPRWSEEPRPRPPGAFDVHARQATHSGDRAAIERLARYILRPPLSGERLERRDDGQIAITLKRAWRDGTAGVLLDPLELVGRLAALVPPPRTNTIRFHGVYAAHARAAIARGACRKAREEVLSVWEGAPGAPGRPSRVGRTPGQSFRGGRFSL